MIGYKCTFYNLDLNNIRHKQDMNHVTICGSGIVRYDSSPVRVQPQNCTTGIMKFRLGVNNDKKRKNVSHLHEKSNKSELLRFT